MAVSATVIANPSDYADLATALLSRAGILDEMRASLAQGVSTTTWTGPAATNFADEASALCASIAADVQALQSVGASLQMLAQQLADELSHLASVESAVQAWLAANPTLTSPWPASSLPPSGDPQWRQVEQAFIAAGIPLTASSAPAAATVTTTSTATSGSVAASSLPQLSGVDPPSASMTQTVLGMPVTPAEKWIIDHEDGSYNTSAYNPIDTPTGHAFGLGQLTDVIRSRYLGSDANTTNPELQLEAMRAYIKERYGTAESAVAWWKAHGWY